MEEPCSIMHDQHIPRPEAVPSEALTYIDAHTESAVAFVQALMAMNSHTPNVGGVSRVQALLGERLHGLGFRVEKVPSGQFAPHIYASVGPDEPGYLIVGHSDTVHPEGCDFSEVVRTGDRITGPGGYDMKAGVGMLLLALEGLKASDALHRIPIKVLIVSDEEVGMFDSADLHTRAAAESRWGLVLESGRPANGIVCARKGVATFKITARGKAVHAGNHYWEGANAILQLSRTALQVAGLSDKERGLTFNIGMFSGGTAANVVADYASAHCDVRSLRAEDYRWARDQLFALPTGETLPGTSLSVEEVVALPAMERTTETTRLAEAYVAAAQAVGTESIIMQETVGGGSSGNRLSAAGLPTIDGLGPYGAGAHTNEEWFSASSLGEKAKILAALLAQGQ